MKIIITESQYVRLNESLNEKELIQNKIKEDGWNKLLKNNDVGVIVHKGFDNNPNEFLRLYNDLEMVRSSAFPNLMLFRNKPNENLMVFNPTTSQIYINNYDLWLPLELFFRLTPEEVTETLNNWIENSFGLRGITSVRNYKPQLMVIG